MGILGKSLRSSLPLAHAWLALLTFWLCLSNQFALAQPSREYELKAVFLLNFSRFTDWPADVFPSPGEPLVIGILGKDPFGPYLDNAVKGEVINRRPLQLQHFKRIEDVKNVHILFISDSETKHLASILAKLQGRSILTVSDMDNFAMNGGMVRFVTINNKIHLRINLDALKAARLTISSKVLRAAEIVTRKEDDP